MAHGRERAVVVGPDKELAREALDRFAGEVDFVPLRVHGAHDGGSALPGLLRRADALMHARPFSRVVATSESTMLAAALLRSRYGLPGLGYEQALTVTNKWRMRGALRSVVPAPRAWLSGDFRNRPASSVPAEVVIKPLDSSSAREVHRMDAARAREHLAGQDRLWLVEEAVAVEREFHCDGVFLDGAVTWSEASEYDPPVLDVAGTRATSVLRHDDPLRPVLRDRAARVVAALGCPDGVFHAEFLYDGDEVHFCELGLRPAGTGIAELIRIATGADLWASFVAAQLGRTQDGYPPVRQAAETAGVIIARPARDGRPPLHPDETRALAGVAGVRTGRLARGETPGHACAFEYLAFFQGLSRSETARLFLHVADGDRS